MAFITIPSVQNEQPPGCIPSLPGGGYEPGGREAREGETASEVARRVYNGTLSLQKRRTR